MTTKISPTEFETWSKRIWKIAEIILENTQENPEKKEAISKIISLFCVRIHLKNTFALEVFNSILSEKFESLPEEVKEKKFDFPCEDGEERKMTGREWAQYLHQRVEDHHRTRVGKDIGDQDLPLIAEKFKKITDWVKDKEKSEKLLSEIYSTNKEDYDLIYGMIDLNDKYFAITNKKLIPEDIELSEQELRGSRYFFADLSQILFRAQEAIEKEKPKAPEKKKEEKKEEKKHQIKTFEEELKELERQNKDLKEKLSEALDPAKKARLEKDLKANKKQREETQARLNNLQRELQNPDNDKSNLALGLGIFAAVVAVICLVILLARPSRRNQY